MESELTSKGANEFKVSRGNNNEDFAVGHFRVQVLILVQYTDTSDAVRLHCNSREDSLRPLFAPSLSDIGKYHRDRED